MRFNLLFGSKARNEVVTLR